MTDFMIILCLEEKDDFIHAFLVDLERKSRERPLPAGLLLSGTLTTRRTAGWAPCMGVSRAVVVSMEQGALLSSRIFETEKSAGSRNDSPGDFTEQKTISSAPAAPRDT